MTRAELLTVLARRLNKNETLDTATKNRLIGMLNEAQRIILTTPGLRRLRDDTQSFASVASQARYVLPFVAKINRIFETTNDRLLQELRLDQYRALDPDPASNTGTPDCFVWTGYEPVAKQPSDSSSLFAKSNSGSDNTQTLYVEGLNSSGFPRSASVALNGTTAVNVSSAITDWLKVTKVYLSAAAVGSVQLWEDDASTGTELARITPGLTAQDYATFLLYPTPASVITYTCDVTNGITDLAQDTDEPRLPNDFHDLLVYAAMAKEYEKTDDTRYPIAQRAFKERLGALQYWLAETASGETILSGEPGRSRLGSWFPAGT